MDLSVKPTWISISFVCTDTDESFSAGTAPSCQQVIRVDSVDGNLVLMISVFLLKGLQGYTVG